MRRSPSVVVLILSAACAEQPHLDRDLADGGDAGSPAPTLDGVNEASAPRPDAADMADSTSSDASATSSDGGVLEAASGTGGDDASLGIDCTTDAGHPVALGCTGLYSSWPTRTIAAGVRPYTPGLALWSDGADKQRYIALPPGTTIDTSDMDEWTFPVGTKLWKEFDFGGQPVETRFLWKTAPATWFRTTYVWSADGASATEVTTGVQNVDGGTYEIPSQTMCTTCHQGRIDGVLGFEAVSLAAPGASGLTLAELTSEGLLGSPPATPPAVPGTETESSAIGWLHANCGTACHNRSPQALAGSTGLFMRLDVGTLASVQTTDVWTTAVGQPSNFQTSADSALLLIDPGNPDNSCIYLRDSTRDDQGQGFQMPPIDTHVVPAAGVALVQAWIQGMSSP